MMENGDFLNEDIVRALRMSADEAEPGTRCIG